MEGMKAGAFVEGGSTSELPSPKLRSTWEPIDYSAATRFQVLKHGHPGICKNDKTVATSGPERRLKPAGAGEAASGPCRRQVVHAARLAVYSFPFAAGCGALCPTAELASSLRQVVHEAGYAGQGLSSWEPAGRRGRFRDEYSQLVLQALAVLLPFPTTFSAYAATKTKYRLTGSAPDMHLQLFSFVPNTEQLIKNKKTSYLPLYGNNFIN
ncbi:uncharacterized protein LOC126176442 [Schistocerca cancellata]|uniref:uncharacterized protein LOC126176442 n=1 Tax=Schistocerca cancellata TaxID=274614 RepID=UPI0021190EE0|nr:uncharacterized protein LOC126176442 [Schistocerca cancellata]